MCPRKLEPHKQWANRYKRLLTEVWENKLAEKSLEKNVLKEFKYPNKITQIVFLRKPDLSQTRDYYFLYPQGNVS